MIYSDSNATGGLQYIPTSGLGLYYELANNIDAAETSSWNSGTGFVPIGWSPADSSGGAPFTGTLNGNGHTISNLTIHNTTAHLYTNSNNSYSQNDVGLFGYSSGTIEDIGLLNVSITANLTSDPNRSAGALVGDNYGTVTNSYATGSVTGNPASLDPSNYVTSNDSGESLAGYVGGLVGINEGTVSNSYANVTVTGGGQVGGLAGANRGCNGCTPTFTATISNSYALGNVNGGSINYNASSSSSFNSSSGGLVGASEDYSAISNSYATGNVTGGGEIGGLVGQAYGVTISNSYATGTETNNNPSADQSGGNSSAGSGGLVGSLSNSNDLDSSLTNSFATGNVIGGYSTSGGLLGNNGGVVTNSYATGNVSAEGTYVAVGGFVGYNGGGGSSGGPMTISNSYATGNVTNTNKTSSDLSATGGFAGINDADIYDSYSIGSVTGGTLSSTTAAGGFVGITGFQSSAVTVNSYSTGSVTGHYAGGFIGANNYGGSGSTLTNCAWYTGAATNAIGSNGSGGGSAVHTLSSLGDGTDISSKSSFYSTSAAVYDQSPMTNNGYSWDFSGTWGTQAGNYPILTGAVPYLVFSGFPASTTAGTTLGWTITAEYNAYGSTDTGYNGTVQIASSDPLANPPSGSTTFTSGVLTIPSSDGAYLTTAGSQTVSAADTTNTYITGTSLNITVSPAAVSKEKVTGGASGGGDLTITTYDAYNNQISVLSSNAATIPASSGIYTSLIIDLSSGGYTAVLGGNITLAGSGTLKIKPGDTLDPGSFTITGSGSTTLDVFGNLMVRASALTGNYASFGTTTLELDSLGASGYSPGTGGSTLLGSKVTYVGSGSSTQTIAALTYDNLSTSGTGGTMTLGGPTTVDNDLKVGSSTTFDPSTFTVTGGTGSVLDDNGTLLVRAGTFGGNYASFGTRTLESGSAVNYIGIETIDNTLTYYNLLTSGSGTQTLGGATSVTNDLTVGSSTTFDPSTFTVTGGALLDDNGMLLVRAGTFGGNYASFTTRTLETGSTVNYVGTETIDHTLAYYNLQTSAGGTQTLNGATSVTHNLSVGASTTVDPSTFTVTGGALLDVTGTLLVRASTFGGNYASFSTDTFESGSTAEYMGISGTPVEVQPLTYYNLTLEGGTNIVYEFVNGQTVTVDGTLTANGTSGNDIKLRSTSTGLQWTLNIPNGDQSVSYVDVEDSNLLPSGNTITTSYSTNSGDNTSNWLFATNDIWTDNNGSGDGNWETATNWSLGSIPVSGNNVVFESTYNYSSTMNGPFSISSLSMQSGYTGTLTLGGSLTLSGNLQLASGSLLASGQAMNIAGSWTNTAGSSAFTPGGNTVSFTGPGTIISDGNPFSSIDIEPGSGNVVTLGDDLSATTLTVASGNLNGGHNLTVTGNASIAGTIGAGTSLTSVTIDGTTTIDTSAISTSNTQTYTGAVTLAASPTLTAGSTGVDFGSTVDGADTLTITGNAAFNGLVGNGTSLTGLSVSGTTNINTTAIKTTSGTQTYTGAVTLSASPTLTAGGTGVDFVSTLDGADTLTITGNAAFNGLVGNGTSLTGLSVSGTTNIDTTAIKTTSGTQTYTGAVTLSASPTLTAGSTGVDFGSMVNGGKVLTITGDATFNGLVGNSTLLTSLSVSGTSDIETTGITTTSTQTYTGAVTLSASPTLTAGGSGVDFVSTVDGADTLTITGNAAFNGLVGNGTSLTGLSVSGTTNINTTGIKTTSGTQTYTGAVTLSASPTLTAGGSGVDFVSTVDGADTLTITGNAAFNGLVGNGTSLTGLSVSGTTNIDTTAIKTTSGTQTYTGAVTLSASPTLTAGGSGVDFVSTVDGADTLTITGNAAFNGQVGNGTSLTGLSVSGTTNIDTTAIKTTSGTQTYTGAVTLSASPTLTAGSTGVDFVSTVDGADTLTITGNAAFNGLVGNGTSLTGLSVSGTTNINTTAIKTTSGTQTYTGAVTLSASPTLTAGSTGVDFGSTVNGGDALTITGDATFNGLVGNSTLLTSLSVSGTSDIETTSVKTSGTQTYTGAVTLSASPTLTAGGTGVDFVSTLDGGDTLTITGNAAFNGLVGNGT